MLKRYYQTFLVIISSASFLCMGCAGNFNPAEARAGTRVPVAAEVEPIYIPYDPNLPKYVLQVQPVNFKVSSITGNTIVDGEVQNISIDVSTASEYSDTISAQLESALSNVGNFVLYDSSRKNVKVGKGEKGPYIVSATITEFNETAEAGESGFGGSLGTAGLIAGIAGAYADKPGLMWGGAAVAAANPTFENFRAKRTGMVAMDVKVVEKNSGRIIRSFPVKGTFTAVTQVNGFSVFGIGTQNAQVAQSALGQAMRVALNDAAQKLFETLTMHRR
ncbi:MAG: hypothetical protein NZO16_05785 [Deltaproteobacteria bacterium]|nr:hypothetical protein [Deltaproteobacteria bacterium]